MLKLILDKGNKSDLLVLTPPNLIPSATTHAAEHCTDPLT